MGKFIKSRKSQGLPEIFAALLIFFISMVFYVFVFKLPGCGGDIPEQKLSGEDLSKLSAEYNIMSFLMAPAEFEGQQLTISELLILYYNNDKYEAPLRSSMLRFLNESNYMCAKICMRSEKSRILKGLVLKNPGCFGKYVKITCPECVSQVQFIPDIGGGMDIWFNIISDPYGLCSQPTQAGAIAKA